jgi:hypothetical protein
VLFLIFCQYLLELLSCILKLFLQLVHAETTGLKFLNNFTFQEWKGLSKLLVEGVEVMLALFDLFSEVKGDHLEFFFEGIE